MSRLTRLIPGCVYILHFDEPLAHAQHYIGCSDDLPNRVADHANGLGARLTQVLQELGMHWTVAAIYTPKPHESLTLRTLERFAKSHKQARDYCPICSRGEHKAPRFMEEFPLPVDFTSQLLRKV